ncbi:nucleoporin complex subunit 54-domain-containing protein [Schizophyllum fasciatum]
MSLFGQPSTSSQPAGGGLFGSTNTANQPSGGLFGSTNTNTQPSGGGLFGASNTNTTQPASGGLFGNSQNQAQNTTGGGLFGGASNTNTNTASSNPLFGGKPAGSLFGNAATNTGTTGGGGLFGSTNTGQQQQQQGQGSSLFGGGTNTNNAGASTGTGLFGSTTNTGQQPAQGGGLFGNTNTNTNSQQQGTKPGGLFGSTNQTGTSTGTGGLFGGGQTQQPSGGLFGQSTTNANPLFGGQSTSTNPLFGGAQQQNQLAPAQSLLMSRATQAQTPPANDPQSQFMRLQARMEEIFNAWNPQSPQCRFQHYFYNLVLPEQVAMYGRPANATNDAAWQEAVRRNPDPSRLVPVPANGFGDLRARVEGQTKHAAEHQEKIKDLQARIAKLQHAHALENHTKLQRAAAAQTQAAHRLLRFVARLYLLLPSVRQSALLPEEEQLRAALEEVGEDLAHGQGGGRMRAKLNELWALVGVLSAARERQVSGAGEWAVVDEEGLARIGQILADQQSGLAHLTKVLKKSQRDIAVIMGQRPTDLDDVDGDELWGSAAGALRASTLR